jgi:hypothetical protein
MQESEKTMTHANCGGIVRRDPETQSYVCDRCHAEAPNVVSSGEKLEGKPEEVALCNPTESF